VERSMCCRHPRKGTGMTREEIIRMAQEAGLTDPDLGDWMTDYGHAEDAITKFANLVEAREREDIALMIERSIDLNGLHDWPMWQRFIAELLSTTAELIRARGKE
jgi:S-formylglutathione hydrolase FrmB